MNENLEQEKTLIESFLNNIGGFESLTFAFVVSLMLSVIIALLKYWILNESKGKEWMFMFLELPIDVCVILITIIVTGFMRGSNGAIDEKKAATGVILVFCSLIISIICCFLRRASMKLSYSEKRKYFCYSVICGVLNFLVAGLWIYVIFDYICSHG